MGTLVWVLVGGMVVVAVVLLVIVDRFRTPMTCHGCGQPKGVMVKRRVEGKSVWMCGECRGR